MNKRRQREAVLILVHGDGWIEAFAERHVDCRIVMVPFVGTPEGEILAEKYVEQNIPWRYRDLYVPGNRRRACRARRILPSDIAYRDWELEFLRSLEKPKKVQRILKV
jgi:hypothetical protein